MSDDRDPRAERLDERVADMKRELMPDRDLWPEISSRLEPRGKDAAALPHAWRPRGWASIGIAVAAGYLLAVWFPLTPIAERNGQQTLPNQLRGELIASWEQSLDQLPTSTRAVVETDLAGFERDWLRIEEALEAEPDNPLLNELLMSAQERARSVQDQLDRLGNDSVEAVQI